jgi:hypothetical protein
MSGQLVQKIIPWAIRNAKRLTILIRGFKELNASKLWAADPFRTRRHTRVLSLYCMHPVVCHT